MQIIDFYNNPNIGLFFYTTDKVTIIPSITPDKVQKIIKDELKTELVITNVYSSSVNNIFLKGDEEVLFAPKIITKEEEKILNKIKSVKLVILNTKLNALGNNMVFHKKKIVLNPGLEDEVIEQLEKLGYKTLKSTIAGVGTVGANLVIIKENGLVNPDVKEKELKEVSEFLGVELVRGTVNNKSNIVKAGLVINKNGVIVSNVMTGPEMMSIEELTK